jgi:hypothetical protein
MVEASDGLGDESVDTGGEVEIADAEAVSHDGDRNARLDVSEGSRSVGADHAEGRAPSGGRGGGTIGAVPEGPLGGNAMTMSAPVYTTSAIVRSRSGATNAVSSTRPSNAAYIRVAPPAVIVPVDGMSARKMSGR